MVKFYSLSFKSSPPWWVFPIIWSICIFILVFLAVPDHVEYPSPTFNNVTTFSSPRQFPTPIQLDCNIQPSFLASLDDIGFYSIWNCSNQYFILNASKSSSEFYPLDNSSIFTQATFNPDSSLLYLFGIDYSSNVSYFGAFSTSLHNLTFTSSFTVSQFPNGKLKLIPLYFSDSDSLFLFNIVNNQQLYTAHISLVSTQSFADLVNAITTLTFTLLDSKSHDSNQFNPKLDNGPELKFSVSFVNSTLHFVWNSKLWFLDHSVSNNNFTFYKPKNAAALKGQPPLYLSTPFFDIGKSMFSLDEKKTPSISFALSRYPSVVFQSPQSSLRVFRADWDVTKENFGEFAYYSSFSNPPIPNIHIFQITNDVYWIYTPYSTGLFIFDPLSMESYSPYFVDLTVNTWNLFDFPHIDFNYSQPKNSQPQYPWDFSKASHVATAHDSALTASISLNQDTYSLVIFPIVHTNTPSVINSPNIHHKTMLNLKISSNFEKFNFRNFFLYFTRYFHGKAPSPSAINNNHKDEFGNKVILTEPKTQQDGLVFVYFIIYFAFTIPFLLWFLWTFYNWKILNDYLVSKIQLCRIHHTKSVKSLSVIIYYTVISLQNTSLLFDPRIPWSFWTFPISSFFSLFSLKPTPTFYDFNPSFIPESPYYPVLRLTKNIESVLFILAMISCFFWLYSVLILTFGASRLRIETRHDNNNNNPRRRGSVSSLGSNASYSSFRSFNSSSSTHSRPLTGSGLGGYSSINSQPGYSRTSTLRVPPGLPTGPSPSPDQYSETSPVATFFKKMISTFKVYVQSCIMLFRTPEERRRFHRELARSRRTFSRPNPFDSDFESETLQNREAAIHHQSYHNTVIVPSTSSKKSPTPSLRNTLSFVIDHVWPFHGYFSFLMKWSLLFYFPIVLSMSRQFSCKFISFGPTTFPLSVIPFSPATQCLSDPLITLYVIVFALYVPLGLYLSTFSHLFPKTVQITGNIETENSIPTSHALQLLLILTTQVSAPDSITYSCLISWILSTVSLSFAWKNPSHSCWKMNHFVLFSQLVWFWTASCSFVAIALDNQEDSISGYLLLIGISLLVMFEIFILIKEKSYFWKCPTLDFNETNSMDNYLVILNRIWFYSLFSFMKKLQAQKSQVVTSSVMATGASESSTANESKSIYQRRPSISST